MTINHQILTDAEGRPVAAQRIKEDDPYQAALFVEALENAILRARKQHQIYPCFDGEFRKV